MMTGAFELFGPAHAGSLGAIVVAAWSAWMLGRHHHRSWQAWLLAGALLGHELFKLWLFVGVDGQPWARSLPLDLCRLNALLCAWLLVRRSYRVFEVSYFWALAGSSIALLTPDLTAGFPDVRFLTFFAGHGSGIVAVLYAMGAWRFQPQLMSLVRALLITAGYATVIALLNAVLDTNYLFLREKPEAGSVLDWFGPWPGYVVAMLAIAVIACSVCYLPFALLPKTRQMPPAAPRPPGGTAV